MDNRTRRSNKCSREECVTRDRPVRPESFSENFLTGVVLLIDRVLAFRRVRTGYQILGDRLLVSLFNSFSLLSVNTELPHL